MRLRTGILNLIFINLNLYCHMCTVLRVGLCKGRKWPSRGVLELPVSFSNAHTHTHCTFHAVPGYKVLLQQSRCLHILISREAELLLNTDVPHAQCLCLCTVGDAQGQTLGNHVPEKSEFTCHSLQTCVPPGMLLSLLFPLGREHLVSIDAQ